HSIKPKRMEPEKTVSADLTRKPFLFFNIGLVTSLSLTIAAFSFKTKVSDRTSDLTNAHAYGDELIDIPVTEQRPPQPKLEQPQIIEVPDEKIIEENITIDMDMEATEFDVSSTLEPVKIDIEEEDPNALFTIVEESASPVGGMD